MGTEAGIGYGGWDSNDADAPVRSVHGLIREVVRGVEHRFALARADGVVTGMPDLDRFLGGLTPATAIVLGAAASSGAATIALTAALAVARTGGSVLFMSDRKSGEELGLRVTAMLAGMPIRKLLTGALHKDDWIDVARAVEASKCLPLFIADGVGDLAEVKRVVAMHRQEVGPPALTMLDRIDCLLDDADMRGSTTRAIEACGIEESAVFATASLRRVAAVDTGGPCGDDCRLEINEELASVVSVVLVATRGERHPSGGIETIDVRVVHNRRGATGNAHLGLRPAIPDIVSLVEKNRLDTGDDGAPWPDYDHPLAPICAS